MRQLLWEEPPAKGKKERSMEEEEGGGEKTLAGGKLSHLSTRSSTGAVKRQAESVGSRFIFAADRQEGHGAAEKHFSIRSCSFCLMVILYMRTTGFSSDI